MGIGENHPLGRKSIRMRRGDLSFGIQTADISIAQIVGEDVDDVRFRISGGSQRQRDGKQGKEFNKDSHDNFRNDRFRYRFNKSAGTLALANRPPGFNPASRLAANHEDIRATM